jgi:hydrogenase maturation protease
VTDPSLEAWTTLRATPPASIVVRGVPVSVGQRVRLRPRDNADVMDLALAGRSATVEGIDVTVDGEAHFVVTVDDDPGRDLGGQRYPGHRFFFRADEIELDERTTSAAPNGRILVAGIGNIFFGDDGFGGAVAHRLAGSALPDGVTVRDFGIRGLDLAYALNEGYDAAILIDAMPRGGTPGTVYVVEPDAPEMSSGVAAPDAHSMDPVRVLELARSFGGLPPRVLIVGCEPESAVLGEPAGDALFSLTPSVAAAADEAVRVVRALCDELKATVTNH